MEYLRVDESGYAGFDLNSEQCFQGATAIAMRVRHEVQFWIQVYFCDPQHPWQRGSNENTNGLLRQYFPKGIDLSSISQAKLNAVARQLNERPRKTLGYETPAERYRQTVASIS